MEDEEVWLPVQDYEGLYEVSDLGRVRSIARRGTLGTVLRPHANGKLGYLRVVLSRDSRTRSVWVHRLVAMAFLGEPEEGQETRHMNGIGGDDRASNLRWGTHAENMQDMVRHGHAGRGRRGYSAKTHCKRDHEFTEENTYRPPLDRQIRICKQCRALTRKRYNERKTAA